MLALVDTGVQTMTDSEVKSTNHWRIVNYRVISEVILKIAGFEQSTAQSIKTCFASKIIKKI